MNEFYLIGLIFFDIYVVFVYDGNLCISIFFVCKIYYYFEKIFIYFFMVCFYLKLNVY